MAHLYSIPENASLLNFENTYNKFIDAKSQSSTYNLLKNNRFQSKYEKIIPHWEILQDITYELKNGLKITGNLVTGELLKQQTQRKIFSDKYYTFYIRIKNPSSKLRIEIEYPENDVVNVDDLTATTKTVLNLDDYDGIKEYRVYFKTSNFDDISPITITCCVNENFTIENEIVIQEISFYEGYLDSTGITNESLFDLSVEYDDYLKIWKLTNNGKDYYRLLVDDGYIDTKLHNIVNAAIENIKPIDLLNKIKQVDGSGSGLDADLLDNLDSSQFVRSDVDDIVNGNIEFKKTITVDSITHLKDNTILDKNLTVNGTSHLIGATTIDGNTSIGGILTVNGNAELKNNLLVDNLSEFKNNVTLDKNLTVNGTSLLKSTVTIQGDVNLSNRNIIGINSLRFADISDGNNEGVLFPVTNSPSPDSDFCGYIGGSDRQPYWIPNASQTTRYKIWHQGNMGSGSGLNADKLDDLDSSQFLRSDINDSADGIITFNKGIIGISEFDLTNADLYFGKNSDGALITFHHYGDDENWLTFIFADNENQDRIRFAFLSSQYAPYAKYSDLKEQVSYWEPILDILSNEVLFYRNLIPSGNINIGSINSRISTIFSNLIDINDIVINSNKIQIFGKTIEIDSNGRLVFSDGTNNLQIGTNLTPEKDYDVTSKKYVDTQISTLNSNLTNKINSVDSTLNSKIDSVDSELTNKINTLTLQDIYNQTPKDENNAAPIKLNSDKSIIIYDENNNAIYFKIDASTGTVTMTGPVIISGNLTVSGKTTIVESQDTTISDNIIILNNGETGAGVSKTTAGIQIDRGTLNPSKLLWNETTKKWDVDLGDGTLHELAFNDLSNVFNLTILNKIKQVDGSGSGLDADLLDGLNSTNFFRFNTNTEITAWNPHPEWILIGGVGVPTKDKDVYISIHHEGSPPGHKCHLAIDGDVYANEGQKQLAYNDLSNVSNSTILNKIKQVDGSGSGLDADLLDGHDSSYFLPKTATAINSDKVDGLHASSFLRRDTSSSPTSDNSFNLGDSSHRWKNIYAVTFQGTAIQAEYADLAEKYTCKDEVEPGDIVQVSSSNEYEIEKCNELVSLKVVGVVSDKPAFLMNEKENGISIALKGKVKCKIKGPIRKGDPIVSYKDGIGISIYHPEVSEVYPIKLVGSALEDIENEEIRKIYIIL